MTSKTNQFDRDMFHDYVVSHGIGPPTEDGYTFGRILMSSGDDYAQAACEVVFRGLVHRNDNDSSQNWSDAMSRNPEIGGDHDHSMNG